MILHFSHIGFTEALTFIAPGLVSTTGLCTPQELGKQAQPSATGPTGKDSRGRGSGGGGWEERYAPLQNAPQERRLSVLERGIELLYPHAPKHGEASNAECHLRPGSTLQTCNRSRTAPETRGGPTGGASVENWAGRNAGEGGVDTPSQNTQARLLPRVLGRGIDAAPHHPYRGNFWVKVTTCWNVGRFWKGKGPRSIPEVTWGRFWSKQDGWGLAAHSPLPPP